MLRRHNESDSKLVDSQTFPDFEVGKCHVEADRQKNVHICDASKFHAATVLCMWSRFGTLKSGSLQG